MANENAGESGSEIDVAITLLEGLIEKAAAFLPSALGALVVLVVGLWFAGRVKKILRARLTSTPRIDQTLGGFLASLGYYALVALVVTTTLGVFGVPTTSFAAVIGASGLAIGFALQGTLSHVASGVMMLGFRPFDIGDFVETAGISGSVRNIGLFTTELASPDNKKIIVPNGKIFEDVIINYGGYDERRVDLVFGVSYDDDLDKAMTVIRSEVEKEARAKKTPAPVIEVDTLGGSSVDIVCRVWVASSDYFGVKWALTKAVKERFDAENVSIPYPTQTLYTKAAG